ncbi:cobalamin biosynthesis protein CobW [Rhodococcus rhodnii]|uniref:Cobalamin biosynthesis protein CobW n=1 Tax=Rhodococcus rhodnii TaxID=38312 RepID=A0A6P2CNA3_9NOCA|nr:cobalamin biosynthesis protein CobW [Rhodococcus rhodnii]
MDRRTPVVLVAGAAGPAEDVADGLLAPGTVLVHHDLGGLGQGVVARSLTTSDDGTPHVRLEILELAHACASCTLREDLLPLLCRLHRRSNVDRIVLHLDSRFEAEAVCWAIEHVIVEGVAGHTDGPASGDVRIEAVVTCLDAETWLRDALGDEVLSDGDDRTVAQLAVGQVAIADALVVAGHGTDGYAHARLHAVLRRLAPGAPISWGVPDDAERLLRLVPKTALRGRAPEPFDALLRGQPPLGDDLGVELFEFSADRPFHPERLHDALDVLFDGVVQARGRVWLVTQPDTALWLESAGGGLRVALAGTWLAAMTPTEQEEASPERRALAALAWDDDRGDRHSSLVVLACGADRSEIDRTLRWALVTDGEWADVDGHREWPDPFGAFHSDPCGDTRTPFAESGDNTAHDQENP